MGQISSGAHTSSGYGDGGAVEGVPAVDGEPRAVRARRAVRGRLAHTHSRTRWRRTRGAPREHRPTAGGGRGPTVVVNFRARLRGGKRRKPDRPAVPRTRDATAVTGLPRPHRRRSRTTTAAAAHGKNVGGRGGGDFRREPPPSLQRKPPRRRRSADAAGAGTVVETGSDGMGWRARAADNNIPVSTVGRL